MEGDFYKRISPLVNLRVRLQRNGSIYEGVIKIEGHRFYLVYSGKEIKIKPTDELISFGKLEKKIK